LDLIDYFCISDSRIFAFVGGTRKLFKGYILGEYIYLTVVIKLMYIFEGSFIRSGDEVRKLNGNFH